MTSDQHKRIVVKLLRSFPRNQTESLGILPGGNFFEDWKMKKRSQEVVKEEASTNGKEETRAQRIEEEKRPWGTGTNMRWE